MKKGCSFDAQSSQGMDSRPPIRSRAGFAGMTAGESFRQPHKGRFRLVIPAKAGIHLQGPGYSHAA